MPRNGSNRLDSMPISADGVATRQSRTGWSPPLQGKRTVASSDSERAGHTTRPQSGKGGKSRGRLRKNPKALAANAAEDSGLSNFPLAISLPAAALNISSISGPGTPGRNLSVISIVSLTMWAKPELDC